MSLFGKILRTLMVDRQAGQKSVAELKTDLASSKSTLVTQLAGAADTDNAQKKLAHVIGIERWAQSRLKVALGDQQLIMDEYDGYRPERGLNLAELAKEFASTRDETLAIADRLTALPNIETQMVEHNDMGDMRVRSWLQYIDMHGQLELRKVK